MYLRKLSECLSNFFFRVCIKFLFEFIALLFCFYKDMTSGTLFGGAFQLKEKLECKDDKECEYHPDLDWSCKVSIKK